MTIMEKRDRIARALSEHDVSGPDDFDQAADIERNMYDRMALAALNSAHLYAIHTTNSPEVYQALAEVTVSGVTVTVDGDSYREWGEDVKPGEALHVVIGLSDPATVETIGEAFDAWGVFADLTDHEDWAMSANDVVYRFQRNWGDWMRINDGYRNW